MMLHMRLMEQPFFTEGAEMVAAELARHVG
jgi:hypothetical protein